MAWKTLRFKITGDAPLLMHNGELANPLSESSKQLKQITSKKKKTDADFARIAEIEFKAGLYMDDDSGPVIPSRNIEAAIYEAAKVTKEGKLAKSVCFATKNAVLQYEGPRDADGLWKETAMRSCAGVKVGQSRVMRTRPVFENWSAVIEVKFEDSVLNASQVIQWVETAGTRVGLGDWRPQHGRFTATLLAKNAEKVVNEEPATVS